MNEQAAHRHPEKLLLYHPHRDFEDEGSSSYPEDPQTHEITIAFHTLFFSMLKCGTFLRIRQRQSPSRLQ